MSDNLSKDEFIELLLKNIEEISNSIDLLIHSINGIIKGENIDITSKDNELFSSCSSLVRSMEAIHSSKHEFREVDPELWKKYIEATDVILQAILKLLDLISNGGNTEDADQLGDIVNHLFKGSELIISLVNELV
ncbi:hypothetical protein HF695_10760 [Bacillus safensis]|uniref:hypothetical protein n=1 Tax=Bacillus safensis TaxID=561879 RepID=UPI001BAC9BE6|nr:hypothetical protein [Bacillus safensis]MBR0602801.1 hypothetical protein [Bacillus safensis]